MDVLWIYVHWQHLGHSLDLSLCEVNQLIWTNQQINNIDYMLKKIPEIFKKLIKSSFH